MAERLFGVNLPGQGLPIALVSLAVVVCTAVGCNDPASIQQSVEARTAFLEKFNEVASDGCQFTSVGGSDMLRVAYDCDGLSRQEMVDRIALSCKTLGSYGVEEVRVKSGDAEASCLVSRSCLCEDVAVDDAETKKETDKP